MKIEVKRFEYGTNFTISRLFLDGSFQCYVLEDVVRTTGIKIKKITAIPAGEYKLDLDFSPRYQKIMPHILSVPGFEGIRIHSGNTDEDTEGCLLVGEVWPGGNMITGSRSAYSKLFPKLQEAKDRKEDILITIVDTR